MSNEPESLTTEILPGNSGGENRVRALPKPKRRGRPPSASVAAATTTPLPSPAFIKVEQAKPIAFEKRRRGQAQLPDPKWVAELVSELVRVLR